MIGTAPSRHVELKNLKMIQFLFKGPIVAGKQQFHVLFAVSFCLKIEHPHIWWFLFIIVFHLNMIIKSLPRLQTHPKYHIIAYICI